MEPMDYIYARKMSRLNETHPKKHLYLNQPSPGQGFAAAAIQDAVSRSAGVSMAVARDLQRNTISSPPGNIESIESLNDLGGYEYSELVVA